MSFKDDDGNHQRSRLRVAGTPTYTPFSLVLLVTTALAPMMQPLAIVTFAVMVTLAPSQTSSTNVMGPLLAPARAMGLSLTFGSCPTVAKTQWAAMLQYGPSLSPP